MTLCDDDSSDVLSLFMVTTFTLMVLLTIAIVGFLIFHLWLIYSNFTTIEFCEKKRGKVPSFSKSPYASSVMNNFKEALGKNPWLWLLPFGYDKPKDSGLHFYIKQIN